MHQTAGRPACREICCGGEPHHQAPVSYLRHLAGAPDIEHSSPTETGASPGEAPLLNKPPDPAATVPAAARGIDPGTVVPAQGLTMRGAGSQACICCRKQPPKKCPNCTGSDGASPDYSTFRRFGMRSSTRLIRQWRGVITCLLFRYSFAGAVLACGVCRRGRFPVPPDGTTAWGTGGSRTGVKGFGTVRNHSRCVPPAPALSWGTRPPSNKRREEKFCTAPARCATGRKRPDPQCTDWHRKGLVCRVRKEFPGLPRRQGADAAGVCAVSAFLPVWR